jgi:hypothetical protein
VPVVPAALRRPAPVAVGAAHLARRDLGVEQGDTAAAPCETGHVAALAADVVELEHDKIRLAAVDAAARLEHRADVSDIPCPEGPWRCRRVRRRLHPPPPGAARRSPPMTVAAHDLAASDLRIDDGDGRCHNDERRDRAELCADMVELEDDGVRFAAVAAALRPQVIENVVLQPLLACTHRRGGLLAVQVTSLTEVGAEARAAPPLAPLPVAVEELGRQDPFASTTGLRAPVRQTGSRTHGRASGGRFTGLRADGHGMSRTQMLTELSATSRWRAIRRSDHPAWRSRRASACSWTLRRIGTHVPIRIGRNSGF